MTFLDWFAGIGGFRRGMELAGHKCVGFCEFDEHAVQSYLSMHCITDEQRERLLQMPLKERKKEILKDEYRNGEWYSSDVTRTDYRDIPRADCWCFGFPCQDISVAGHQKGFEGNRSSLFFRITGLIKQLKEEDRPSTLFIENVKNLLSINGGWDFARVLIELDEIGYDAEWEVLNSKDFGVPQNRERCFIIGHLRGCSRREVFPLRRVAEETDIQGHEVDSSLIVVGNTNPSGGGMNGKVYSSKGLSPTISTNKGEGPRVFCSEIKQIAKFDAHRNNPNYYRVYDKNGLAPCLQTMEGGGREPHIITENSVAIPVLTPDRIEKRQNGRRFKENGDPMFTLTAQDRHGVVVDAPAVLRNVRSEYGKEIRKDYEAGKLDVSRHDFLELEPREDGVSNTISTVTKDNLLSVPIREATKQGYAEAQEGDSINFSVPGSETRRGRVGKGVANTLDTGCQQGTLCGFRIRKLTPKECFRLQGWTDDYFEKAEQFNSNTQLYKQAGNGVTVNVIKAIADRFNVTDDEVPPVEEDFGGLFDLFE